MKLFRFLFLIVIFFSLFSCSESVKDIPENIVLDKIEIKQYPDKLEYIIGKDEVIDITGLIVEGIFSNDERKSMPVTMDNIYGFSMEKPVEKLPVTVRIEDKEDVFYISVIEGEEEKPLPPEVVLESISVKQTPVKTVYMLNSAEDIDLTGLIVEGQYSDGEVREVSVTKDNIHGFGTLEKNDKLPITVRVKEKEAVFYISIVSDVLDYVENTGDDVYIVPEYIRSIAASAFVGTTYKNVELNEGLESIGENAFLGTGIQNINFPSTLKSIGKNAFYKCHSLNEVDLSKTKLTVIDESVFQYSGVSVVTFPETLLKIADEAFMYTNRLSYVNMPLNLEIIGMNAFRFSAIKSVKLPNSIQIIKSRAFASCNNLESVKTYKVPISYKNGIAETYIFEKCPKIKELEYPESISVIGMTQLSEKPCIETLFIGENITNIGFNAFGNAERIDMIIINALNPPVLDFYSLPKNVSGIKVPAESLDSYKSAKYWSGYENKINSY